MERRERHSTAQAIAYSLQRFGHAVFTNDDGTRIFVAVRRPIGWDSEIRYSCTGCTRRLWLTMGESVTNGADAVRAFVEHTHAEVN